MGIWRAVSITGPVFIVAKKNFLKAKAATKGEETFVENIQKQMY